MQNKNIKEQKSLFTQNVENCISTSVPAMQFFVTSDEFLM
jgi:hypothetical protein